MPSFNRQHQNDRGIRWRGIAATAMVELLVLFVFAFAVVRYVEWSSDANQAEFMSGQSLLSASPQDSLSAVAGVGHSSGHGLTGGAPGVMAARYWRS
jgi:hypothetical protein